MGDTIISHKTEAWEYCWISLVEQTHDWQTVHLTSFRFFP